MQDRSKTQTNVRLPTELKRRLERSADQAGRSLAAEVVARLESSFGPDAEAPPGPPGPERAGKGA